MPGAAIALIDGEHHPAAVVDALDRLAAERGLAGVVFCGGEEKLGPGPLDGHYGREVETDPEAALRRLAPGATAVVDLADEPVLPPTRKFAPGGAGAAPRALLRGARHPDRPRPRYEDVDTDARHAGRDRHRQAHRQDRGGRPLGRAAARARGPAGDRLHGPRRAGRSRGAPAAGVGAGSSCSRSTPAASTRPPTTSRTRRWPACPPWAAGAWAAAWRASPPSRTWRRGRRWRPRSTRARSCSRARAPASRRWRSSEPCAWWGGGGPSRSPSTGCCGPTSCWRPRAPRRPPGRFRFDLRPEPVEPLPEGATGGALHHGRGALRGRGSGGRPPPTSLARGALGRGPRHGPPRRAVTSTSPS